jgi:hypothetical protein
MACGFLLLLESVPRASQPIVGAVLMVSEGLTLIIWTGYLMWINTNVFYFIYFTILLNFIGLVGCLYV